MSKGLMIAATLIVVVLAASGALAGQHPGAQMPMGGQSGQQAGPMTGQPMMGAAGMGMMCPMIGMMPMMQSMMMG